MILKNLFILKPALMNKTFIKCSLLVVLIHSFIFITTVQASKIISLKDGSTLKGKVVALNDGIYTIETTNLGNITILETDILSISSAEPYHKNFSDTLIDGQDDKTQLKLQVEKMQGTILKDQELMTDIESIANDEEIKSLISDPNLLNDVMSMDENKIQQNDKIQNLMNNPKMRDLMNKIQQKIPAQ